MIIEIDQDIAEGGGILNENSPAIIKLPLPLKCTELQLNPLKNSDIDSFREWLNQQGISATLIEKVINNTRFISKEKFVEAIQIMAAAIDEYVGNSKYYLHVKSFEKSEGFILDLILPLLKHKPTGFIATKRGYQTADSPLFIDTVPLGQKVVHIDDVLISGNQDTNSLNDNPRIFNSLSRFKAFYVAATAAGKLVIENQVGCDGVFSVYQVPTNQEIYSSAECDQLKKLVRLDAKLKEFEAGIQTFLFYKVPDNVAPFFRMSKASPHLGGKRSAYLIDDGDHGYRMQSYPQKIRNRIDEFIRVSRILGPIGKFLPKKLVFG